MKRIMMLAISAILVANMSAQEQKKECFKGKELSKEERVEMDIKRFKHELFLSDKQAEKFAVIYREYAAKVGEIFENGKALKEKGKEWSDEELEKAAKARLANRKKLIEVQEKFYDKFRKELNPRQVSAVLRLDEFGPKHECGNGPKPGCPQEMKHEQKRH